MADVFIDAGVVQRLVSSQLQTAINSTIPVRIIGEGEPDNQSMVARLQSITITPAKRKDKDAHVDLAAIEIVATVTLGQDQTASGFAVGSAVATLRKALAYTTLRDTDTTHTVEIDDGAMVVGMQLSEQQRVEGGSVTWTGRVRRETGATVEDHLS